MNMYKFLRLFIAIFLTLCHASSVDAFQEQKVHEIGDDQNLDDPSADPAQATIEKAIEKFEATAASAGKQHDDGILPSEDTDIMYETMVDILNDVTESVKNSNNAYKFLKSKGLDRIVAPNIMDIDDELKTNLLILLKVLFDVAPTTTKAVIPTSIVDGLLDIFEKDNVALKAHALDVLYVWLPGNPRIQTRVMKLKGLEPFYKQITNLDNAVIKKLLDLFNNLLNEHLKVKNEMKRNKIDSENAVIYQRIGLIERMSTPLVCNGLLNIFVTSWTYKTNDNNLIITVFDLLKNVKQFCMKVFRGKTKAIDLFNALFEYVNEPQNYDYFEANGVNVAEMKSVIEEYVNKVKLSPKDEF